MTLLDDLEWIFVKTPLSSNEVDALQRALNVQLPVLYVQYLQAYHGGKPTTDEFEYGDNVSCIQCFFPGNEKFPKAGSLLRKYSYFQKRLPDATFPFGRTPGGDLICFDYSQNLEPQIVLCDHEVDDAAGCMQKHFVSADFESFLKNLA